MIITTETSVSKLEQIKYYPLSAIHIAFLKAEDTIKEQGQVLLERYRYEDPCSDRTIIGLKGRL